MSSCGKRLKKNIARNQLLDRELDYLPSTVERDAVREIARRYGPLRRRSLPVRLFTGLISFVLRYGAPFLGLLIGAEYRAAKALYPLMGEEQQFGDSLKVFLGEGLARKVDDTNKVMKMTGALVSATPEIIMWALYGVLLGILFYYLLKWALLLATGFRRKRKMHKRITELVG
jgi:hypothetical protein